ncbi:MULTISPECIES: hypothetical protein [unclassified Mesorhizobium]|uniref:hypothetical protein n=1 Tax=unclassified Mesorhizobium TaxID=325217 RepID=UPI002417831E|nr:MULTISPECIES: hypothetical protein [unclassified Mesorhizobium]WFP60815.1 hypothetical protein QAZ47_20150 [Mesorhizobium sp. WSM4904]WFP74037.1 hypothetical protein QAZ22_20055 [Mesorhizobium sp. WSM4906]
MAGLVLRLLGARGDLWLDEIWSLTLLKPLTSIDQIFWRVNHDNNHFLNSFYLYLVGPDTSPLIQRGLSIALGVLTIPAAAAAAAPRGRWAMIATSLLFSISFPMVEYGSEARGYAGLVLFTLLSLILLERRLDKGGSAFGLAAMILLGILSHLTMIETAAILAGGTLWLTLRSKDSHGRTLIDGGQKLWPIFAAVLPVAACVALLDQLFGFKIGGLSQFSWSDLVQGYGGLIKGELGLPSRIGDLTSIIAACALVCVSAFVWRDRRASLYVIGIVGLPLVMGVARLPNLGTPRYFLVSGTLLLLWTGEMLGRGFDAGRMKGLLAFGALAVVVAGAASSLLGFYQYGRGSYSVIVEKVTANGTATYASNSSFRTVMVVDYFAARSNRKASLVPQSKVCAERPGWLIYEGDPDAQPVTIEPKCGDLVYDRAESSRYWGLSGLSWTLYQGRPAPVLVRP